MGYRYVAIRSSQFVSWDQLGHGRHCQRQIHYGPVHRITDCLTQISKITFLSSHFLKYFFLEIPQVGEQITLVTPDTCGSVPVKTKKRNHSLQIFGNLSSNAVCFLFSPHYCGRRRKNNSGHGVSPSLWRLKSHKLTTFRPRLIWSGVVPTCHHSFPAESCAAWESVTHIRITCTCWALNSNSCG